MLKGIEDFLKEQLTGDILYDGINNIDLWLEYICLGDVVIIGGLHNA